MTSEERELVMADPVAVEKARVVRELGAAISKAAISGAASASISAAGGSKSWSQMSVSERRSWWSIMKRDLNAYILRHFGIDCRDTPPIRHVRIARWRW